VPRISVASQAARDMCIRFPSATSLGLARKLYSEKPKLFTSVEQARNSVRYHRGERGKSMAKRARPVAVRKQKTLRVPKSSARLIKPYKLKAKGRGLVISDVHIPHHDEKSLLLALQYAIKQGYKDFVILNGDILDAYQLSAFVRDPRERDFGHELKLMREFLGELARHFGHVLYKLGNHERRYESYMRLKAPELLDIDEFSWSHLLRCHETGVTLIPDRQVIHAGELTILHGHEYGRGVFSPVNAARGMYLRAKACSLSGHLHSTSQHNEADIRSRLVTCWSTGCLCGLTPEYAPLNRWDHGFALLEFDGRWFQVQTKRIVKGRIA
jgi:predicted phosphodiesterase